jgi:hypothetical protein
MSKKKPMLNPEVDSFLDKLNPLYRREIDILRALILEAFPLDENIKWNGPNYSINNEDRITMRVNPPTKLPQLILHRGAKKQAQPAQKLIDYNHKLLTWKENDRAVLTITHKADLTTFAIEIKEIIELWMKASLS